MTTFEKSIVLLVSSVAFVMLIAILVLCSVNAIELHNLQAQHNLFPRPKITRDRHGNLEIELPEEFEEPPIPNYRPGNKEEKK